MERKRPYNLHLKQLGVPLTKYAKAKRKKRIQEDAAGLQETSFENPDSLESIRKSEDEFEDEPWEPGEEQLDTPNNSQSEQKSGLDELRKEIHNNGDVTVGNLVVLVLAYGKRHGLSRSATLDLFRLLKTTLPGPAKDIFPDTWHKLDVLMEDLIPAYEVHYYCPEHLCYLGSGRETFACPVDNSEIRSDQAGDSYFVVLPLRESLSLLLENFGDSWERHMGKEPFIQQEGGGQLHHSTRNHFNLGARDLTLTLHSDGAWLRKTKWADGRSCHMVQLVINELPKSFRDRNVLVHSVYCGKDSVPHHVLLTPLMYELNLLMTTQPLEWTFGGASMTSRIICDRVVCDAAERYKLVNMRSHQAYYGCTTCKQKGCVCGTVHVFEYVPYTEIREHEEMVKTGQTAAAWDEYEQDKMEGVLKGVTGPSVFSQLLLPTVNLPRSFPGDFYHLFVEGLMAALLRIWLKEGHLDVKLADQRILEIRPNLQAKRLPRKISECHNRYQGHELLFLLLFYGFPVFRGALPEDMYENYCQLAYVAHIALQDEISQLALDVVDRELNLFMQDFERLYGRRQMSYNVHQLRHFAMNLEDWGPAQEFWTLQFESALGYRTRRVHGTQHTAKEIARTSALDLAVTTLQKKVRSNTGTEVQDLLESFIHPQRTKRGVLIESSADYGAPVCLKGCVRKSELFQKLFPDLYELASSGETFGNADHLLFSFKCVVEKGFMCATDDKPDKRLRNSSFVFLRSGRLLELRFFYAVKSPSGARTYAVGQLFNVLPYQFSNTVNPGFRFVFSAAECCGLGRVKTADVEFSALEIFCDGDVHVFVRSPNCLNFDI